MKTSSDRIIGLDIIRAFSIIFVFCYHFTVEYMITGGGSSPVIYNINYVFNILARPACILLFIISGYALIYNHEDELGFFMYFKGRFRGLMIPFYVCYIIMWIVCFVVNGQLVGVGIPKKFFIFTILGIDALAVFYKPTFYMIGEWFMTCIVICYALFPLLAILLKKLPRLTMVAHLAVYITLLFIYYPFIFEVTMNPLLVISYFYMGMLLRKCTDRIPRWLSTACTIVAIAIFVFYMLCGYVDALKSYRPIEGPGEVIFTIWSLSMIIALLGVSISPISICYKMVSYISGISWYIILIHHVTMQLFFIHLPVETYSDGVMLVMFIACVLITWVLSIVARRIVRCIQRVF